VGSGASKALLEIRERAKACNAELVALETRAGIAAVAEKVRTKPPNYFLVYDVGESNSDERREAIAAEEQHHKELTIRHLRDLYFGVSDVNLRKNLIAKAREEGDLAVTFFEQELSDASANLATQRTTGRDWWIWASIGGLAAIGVGFYLFGLVGALGGLLVGYVGSRRIELNALQARERAVKAANDELKEAERIFEEVRNEPQIFSRREASTGEPDPDRRGAHTR
jgi:hypothetical protein